MTIPNIVHVIFFYNASIDFNFVQYVAIKSARIINKCVILIHYDVMPEGKWTTLLKMDDTIKWICVPNKPTHIGVKEIKKIEHVVDIYRLLLLYEFGGIYLDLDTICVRPWELLLENKFVGGIESKNDINVGMCNAIMMSEARHPFLKKWLDFYEHVFDPDSWAEASVYLPLMILETNNFLEEDKIKICVPEVFFKPDWSECEKIWTDETSCIPESLITLHLWNKQDITIIHMNDIVQDFNWVFENQHTLYSKLVINVFKF